MDRRSVSREPSVPTTITIPSGDSAFRNLVDNIAAQDRPETAADLQLRLRKVFPRVVVRERSLAGEQPAWYVYRDGGWRSPATGPWWLSADTPRVRVSTDGWVIDANETARGILGIDASDMATRHFTDFVVPGTLTDARDLFEIIGSGHELTATIRVRPTTGDVIAVDLHAELDGDAIVGLVRLADDVPPGGEDGPFATPTLECRPRADRAFGSYAELALSRMPQPTPDGLALRLRRLYPHARVEVDGDRWLCSRDADSAGPVSAGWWKDERLPTVRYDGEGLILEANDAARRLLGSSVVGRHWHDLVTPGSTEQVTSMLEILARVGGAESRFRMPNVSGALVEFDSYTTVVGDSYTTVMSLVDTDVARAISPPDSRDTRHPS